MAKPWKNHIISKRRIREFLLSHPEHANARKPLLAWYQVALTADWPDFVGVRRTFASADRVGDLVVFNIKGNDVRLVARIMHGTKPRRIYIRAVLPHEEYDESNWKEG